MKLYKSFFMAILALPFLFFSSPGLGSEEDECTYYLCVSDTDCITRAKLCRDDINFNIST